MPRPSAMRQYGAKDLGNRSIAGVAWGAGGSALRIVAQLVTQIILARLLGPEQYGLFAIGALVVMFTGLFADSGIAYGLIQKQHVSDDDLRFVFFWQAVTGGAITLVIMVCSGAIAAFFGDPRAVEIIKVLSVVCLINAVAAPSSNLLKRELRFKEIQLAQLLGYFGGYVLVGVPMALFGQEVWALVAAWITQSTLMLVLLYRVARHPLKPKLLCVGGASMIRYGTSVLATNLINWVISNIDRIVVGRVYPSSELGLYSTSLTVLYTPTMSLLGVVQPVFFSAAARTDGDTPKITIAYKALIGAVALLMLPAFVGLAVVADTFVLAVYGPSWQSAATTLQPLALAMPFLFALGLTTPVLWSQGRGREEFRSQLPIFVMWLPACWLAAQFSLAAVAWGVMGLCALRCIRMIALAIPMLRIEFRQFWQVIRGGVLVSLLIGVVLAGVDSAVRAVMLEFPVTGLVTDIIVGAAVLLCLLRWIPNVVAPEVQQVANRFAHASPPWIAGYISFWFTPRRRRDAPS